jgi:ATP phosphoribosyltransferase regulatory subunit
LSDAAARSNASAKRAAAQRVETIVTQFQRKGFVRCEPAILQRVAPFVDHRGEDFLKGLYATSDQRGVELCLRPEYTIPVCLDYLASPLAGQRADFAYGGPVFVWPGRGDNEDGEYPEVGLESFGRDDREAADAEILAATLEAAAQAGGRDLDIRLGDAGLVSRFIACLDLPPVWRRRLAAGYQRGLTLEEIFTPPKTAIADSSGIVKALEQVGADDARKLVQDLLSLAGIAPIGGRGADEIAERFLEQAALAAGDGAPQEKRALTQAFFSIEDAPDVALKTLGALASSARLDLARELDALENRINLIAATGLSLDDMRFSTHFSRRLDYYTGFVFEARSNKSGVRLCGGGRYDHLLKTLGARTDIPAVGAALWPDVLENGA